MRGLIDRLSLHRPIFQAPMAGGPDTPELAAAVSSAGGLGALGCAYSTPEQIDARVARLRALTTRPFALNLFVRADAPDDAAAEARVVPVLSAFRRELGLADQIVPGPAAPDFDAQLEAVIRAQPAVFSFTFGVPAAAQLAALRRAGILVMGTATTLEEAELLEAAGVDAVCAQGAEAGGHRGTFRGRFDDALIGTIVLARQIVERVRLPVVAAGGIMDGAGVRAALALGADAAQLGTAFMLCPEAGTHQAHRAALSSEAARRTVVTAAFSGRPARGIRNRVSDAFLAVEPAPFPQHQRLTAELRAAAAGRGRTDLMQLWAGQGAPLARALPAAELVGALAREAGLD